MGIDRRTVLLGMAAAGGALAACGRQAAVDERQAAAIRTIPLEEHVLPASVLGDWDRVRSIHSSGPGARDSEITRRLQDFTETRLSEMDQFGIEMAVLSLTVPGPQGDPNPVTAHQMAMRGNDAIANAISGRPDRFAAFGCLAMHDVDQACREFERVVRDLNLKGVLLNGFQYAGADGEQALFYDDRRFDPFWETAQRLDAPVYLHPGSVYGVRRQDLEGYSFLGSAAWWFAANTGLHALRIITGGVFDRYPRAQLVLGHLGEHVVFDLWRIDNRVKYEGFDMNLVAAKNSVSSYFSTNVHVTTSGQFDTPALAYAIEKIGVDRIMFSVDYPYEANKPAMDWFHSLRLNEADLRKIGRGNVISLLKLPLKA